NLWENIKIHFIYEERSISEALYNPHLKEPPLRPINKDEFLYDFSEKGLYYAVKKNAPLFKAYNSSLGHLKLWSKNWLRQTKKREKIFLIINNFYQKYIVNRIYGS
ncbi:MAG: hypothetical protein LIO93_04030, partial [Bacteroidales bacterium]|nr:hypothetical protein [Bacteroidales bacterium]